MPQDSLHAPLQDDGMGTSSCHAEESKVALSCEMETSHEAHPLWVLTFFADPIEPGSKILPDGSGGDEASSAPQMTKPALVTEPSEDHDRSEFAAMSTLLGPLLPLYRVPAIVT
jgi:hypothetical protein